MHAHTTTISDPAADRRVRETEEDSLVRWMDRMLDMPLATAEAEKAAVTTVASAGRHSNL